MNASSHFLQHSIQASTHSLDKANQYLNHIIGPHELVDLSDEQPLNFSFQGEQIGGVIIGDLIYGKDVIFKTQQQEDMHFYCITRPKIGKPIFYHMDGNFEANSTHAAIVSPFDKFELTIDRHCIQSFISISKPLIENTLSDLIQRPIDAPLEFDHVMSIHNERINAWWNLVEYFSCYRNTGRNFDCLIDDIRNDFEKMLVKSLLLSQPHNYSHLLHRNHTPKFVENVLNYIHKNIQHHICSEELEYISGIPSKKLSQLFREHMKVSIHGYIRYYRLKCIYEELSITPGKKNITNIAMKWGINHLGRFSAEYKQQFGESPSDTVRKSIHPELSA